MATDPDNILKPRTLAKIEAIARSRGKTASDVLDEAIEELARRVGSSEAQVSEVSLLDRMNRVGGIGMIETCPADLSTNPKHMEGFGKGE